MIKKFDEFINESNEQYILYIRLGESDSRLKDNIEKIICDALNKIAYDDDCQIICVLKAKWYDEVPRVEFKLKEVEEYE